ncbi:site-2 protease family protein [Neobacillus sp. Marseille-QA0830]
MKKDNSKKTKWGVLGALAALILGKLKFVLVVLKLLKLQTLVSMFISLGSYALIFGWKFAVALIYLLFVHEMGHAYAAKRLKLPVTPALFIPFVGAAVGLKQMPKNAKDEGYLAYMGPFFGLLSFLPAWPLYMYTHEPFWALLIIIGSMINLFNLIPITPLDGGRIAAGISTKLWGAGIVLLLIYSVINLNLLGLIIVILGAREWYKLNKKQKSLQDIKYEVQALERFVVILKQGTLSYEVIQEEIRKANWKISQPSVTKLLNQLNSEIETMKRDIYLQMLSGEPVLGDGVSSENQQAIDRISRQLQEQLAALKKDVHTTETYYKTNKKTKLQLFLIYLALVLALAINYHYGNAILESHPEIQRLMNR